MMFCSTELEGRTYTVAMPHKYIKTALTASEDLVSRVRLEQQMDNGCIWVPRIYSQA